MVDLLDINKNYPDKFKYSIIFLRGNIVIVTKELLKQMTVPGIGFIPIYSEDYIKESKNITHKQIENIMFK